MKTVILTVFALLLTTATAHAAHYIEANLIDPALLTPPPPVDSDQWKADIEAVLKAQRAASPADKEAITAESELGVAPSIAPLGDYTEKSHPAAFALVENLRDDCKGVVKTNKIFWNTRRPYLEDNRIQDLAEKTSDNAYPSGHTACSRLYAEVLGQVVPAKREELRVVANKIAWHRVQAGVHYPHDLNGGRQLAMLMLGALQTNAAFLKDLAAAKAEIAAKQ